MASLIDIRSKLSELEHYCLWDIAELICDLEAQVDALTDEVGQLQGELAAAETAAQP